MEPEAEPDPEGIVIINLDREREDNKDFTVTKDGLVWLADLYCPDKEIRLERYASPYYDDMRNMPPMLLACARTSE